jgi:hypothetical protein
LSEDWLAAFENLLNLADQLAKTKKSNIDWLKANKIAGLSRQEVENSLFADLMIMGNVQYAAARLAQFQPYLDEVFGKEEVTT